ncbi:hypothetical protein STEG23_016021 [Scotinomys teguina]
MGQWRIIRNNGRPFSIPRTTDWFCSATIRLVLTPQMGVQLVDSDFQGPLEPGTVGLLIGRSSTILQDLKVHSGIIDSDYTGVVKIMVESPKGISAISPGDRIAQLIILPSLHSHFAAKTQTRGDKGFRSTGTDLTFLSLDLDQRPIIEITVDNKCISGLLDTGADRSIIAKKDWPSEWPIQKSSQSLQGLGYAKTDISARQLQWKDDEGHSGNIQPYVLPLPVSLWGQDLMTTMGYKLSNDYSPASRNKMLNMGFHPNHGLGKFLQGRKDSVQPQSRNPRQGLGFS